LPHMSWFHRTRSNDEVEDAVDVSVDDDLGR